MKNYFKKNKKVIYCGLVLLLLVTCIFTIPTIAEFLQSATEYVTVSLGKTDMSLNVGETENLEITVNTGSYGDGIYVAPNGNDDADGGFTTPLLTIQEAIDRAKPGDTVYLREGTYTGNNYFNNSGSKDGGFITITAYNNENAVVTTKKGVNGAAFELDGCDYIKFQNLKIADMNAAEVHGILMTGDEKYIYIENCEFTNIVTTNPNSESGESNAILLLGEKNTAEESISNIYIDNNIIHDNVNGWSENISVAGNCEYVYVTNNKVYDCTNIGIDFYGNAEYCSNKALDQARHCECIGNIVYNCLCSYAENAGIYVDGAYDILIENNETYNNYYGIEIGSEEWRKYYDDNNRVREITVKGNNIHDNLECGIRIGGWSNNDTETGYVYNCDIIENIFHNNMAHDGSEIILAKCDSIRFKDNIFDEGINYEDAVWYDDEIDPSKITNISFQ